MGYLTANDYLKQIQDANLQQLISSNANIMSMAELAAEAEAISLLTQKFDTDAEFTDTNPWNPADVYNALGLVPASEFEDAKTEVINKLNALQAGGARPTPEAVVVLSLIHI